MIGSAINSQGRALFLDRDGVINEEVNYLWRREDVRFVPGIFALCRTAKSLSYQIVIATNQAGIGRGMYTEQDFHSLMDWMRSEFAHESVSLDAIYFSPWHPEKGVGEYRREHEDRKPGTGMLRRAAADLGISLQESIMVGDRCTDVAAANAAGLRQAFLIAGTETTCPGNFIPVTTLSEVEAWLSAQTLVTT
jgi:D-glycero-D-manno-heptose 1,7-bisphosphate phosphatase